jgi:UDP-N-acetylglucosamine 2-epimerase (non-hydrolysing)
MNIACVVGARPNFMKIGPLLNALRDYNTIRPVLIHTGQHYDAALSDIFFTELGIRQPDVFLEVGSGSHGVQTARVLERFEATLANGVPGGGDYHAVIVVGDVNSTLAASLAAAKMGIRVIHVEAGLRSFDRRMPEEINRIVTDSISDLLLVSEPAGVENLRREGHSDERVHLVGNVMIDTLLRLLPMARDRDLLSRLSLLPQNYGVVTLHRPANVDCQKTLTATIDVLLQIEGSLPLVFPIHPRTKGRLEEFGLLKRLVDAPQVIQLPPLGYLDFLALTSQAKLIITDSGGLQEESTALGVPCLTMRDNTERPITVTQGTSTLIGSDPAKLDQFLRQILGGTYKHGSCPELWDGHAAERICRLLVEWGNV